MKRILPNYFIVLFILLLTGWNSGIYGQAYSGGGPGLNPDYSDAYLISTLADLQYLSEHSSDWSLFFLQTADIDATATSGWNSGQGFIPIGSDFVNAFSGGYDGQGHTISNLYINRPLTDFVGLFGSSSGIIINLGVVDADITGGNYTGAIGGAVYEVDNCFSTGTVNGTDYVGGIAGDNLICTKSYSYCTVTGNMNVGGLLGEAFTGWCWNSYARGDVTGILNVGGLVGTCFDHDIQWCYSTGIVSGPSNPNKPTNGDVGGLIGDAFNTVVENCFWDTQTSGMATSSGGTGKTTAEMKRIGTYLYDPSLFVPWDFTAAGDIWGINGTDNGGYPFLRYQGFPSAFIWAGTTSEEWSDPDNWSDGAVPASSDMAIIPDVPDDDPVLDDLASISRMKIEQGGHLSLTSTGRLTVIWAIINETGITGLVLDPDASLVNGTAGVPGTVNRNIVKDGKWHFLSCPISQATMPEICDGNFAPLTTGFPAENATYDFFYWQEPPASGNLNWINLKGPGGSPNTTNFGNPPRFESGKGYLVEYGSSYAGDALKSFAGELGAGSYSITVTNTAGGPWSGYNLIGNTYPSSIDWKAPSGWDRTPLEMVGPTNTRVRTAGGYMFWIWNDVSGNYGYYNSALPGDVGGNGASRYIPPTQAFFVKAQTGGNVTVYDDVRCHSTQAWLKEETNTLRVRVNSSVTSYSDEVLLAYNSMTAGGSDKLFSFYEEAPSLYLPLENNNYSIRFIDDIGSNPAIPVNFISGKEGNYTLTVSGTAGLSNVYLQDLKTGVMQDVKATPSYTFAASSADDADRFLIRFTPVGIDRKHSSQDIFVYDNVLNVNNPGNSTITVYNMTGMKVLEKQAAGEQVYRMPLQMATGTYVVKVTNGTSVWSAKVFVK